jgi:hypothetical protein
MLHEPEFAAGGEVSLRALGGCRFDLTVRWTGAQLTQLAASSGQTSWIFDLTGLRDPSYSPAQVISVQGTQVRVAPGLRVPTREKVTIKNFWLESGTSNPRTFEHVDDALFVTMTDDASASTVEPVIAQLRKLRVLCQAERPE